jgi:3-oxoacyl-[acyl-carrier-protein] synthase III
MTTAQIKTKTAGNTAEKAWIMESTARITALGAYVPPKVLTNDDLSKMVDTSDEWIIQRTGIRERRIAAADVFASDLGSYAVTDLVNRHPGCLDGVDFVIAATFTADFHTPAVAAIIQGRAGLPSSVGSFDLNAACAGFTHALMAANAYITAGLCRKVLVVATEATSKITDYTDRATCVLFGDGAVAVLVERDESNPAFLGFHFGSDGGHADKVYATGLAQSLNGQPLPVKGHFWQDGRAVYNYTIKVIPEGIRALCRNAGMNLDGIDWFVPHSANLRIIQSICEKLPFPFEKTLTSVERFGNTSSASIPLALWLAMEEGKLKKGDRIILYGFGGGLNHAGLIVRW